MFKSKLRFVRLAHYSVPRVSGWQAKSDSRVNKDRVIGEQTVFRGLRSH